MSKYRLAGSTLEWETPSLVQATLLAGVCAHPLVWKCTQERDLQNEWWKLCAAVCGSLGTTRAQEINQRRKSCKVQNDPKDVALPGNRGLSRKGECSAGLLLPDTEGAKQKP